MWNLSSEFGLQADVPSTTKIYKSQLKFQDFSYNFELYEQVVRKLCVQA